MPVENDQNDEGVKNAPPKTESANPKIVSIKSFGEFIPGSVILSGHLETVESPTAEPTNEALSLLDALGESLTEAQKPIVARFQEILLQIEGKSFGSFAENQRVAAAIQEFVSRLGWAISCPREDCQQPAKLRCLKSGRSKNGTFQFDHFIEGRRTHHGGSTVLPRLTLIEPLPDNRRTVSADNMETE